MLLSDYKSDLIANSIPINQGISTCQNEEESSLELSDFTLFTQNQT